MQSPLFRVFTPISPFSSLCLRDSTLEKLGLRNGLYTNILHSSTTAWSSQMWFLRLVYNRNACDSREAEFNRKPVKVTIQTLRSSAPHPFLTSLLLKLASGVFSHQTWVFASMDKNGTQRKSVNMCSQQSCYKVYKRLLLSPDVNFAFKEQKWNSTEICES